MNQLHKDIIKRLRAVTEDYEATKDIPTRVFLFHTIIIARHVIYVKYFS